MPEGRRQWLRQWGPEALLAALACLVFLGSLGATELWGKREQRAVAESIDTVDNGHWLVAEIQARPRLEKPPLPRWTTSLLVLLTGRRSEWLMRLPAALSALGLVAVTYALGRRIGGRAMGLASALVLCSMVFFVVEMRQAGNDGPLSLFVGLAVYCAWRRLHGNAPNTELSAPAATPGPRRWVIAMYGALGLGFLCKGPVAILIVALAVLPYLAVSRSLVRGCRALLDWVGLLLLVLLALSWPVPVLMWDPKALDVWMLEMGQKAGTAGITHHRWRGPVAFDWPAMTAPWTILISIAVVAPLLRLTRRPTDPSPLTPHPSSEWLPWFWAVANLAMFCLWSVAKPNYYLPCMPAVAILGGLAWSWLAAAASETVRGLRGGMAMRLIRAHWIAFPVGALGGAAYVSWKWPAYAMWAAAGAAVLLAGVFLSFASWRRGRPVGALGALVGALAVLVTGGYALIGPRFNHVNSHHTLARAIERLVPADERVVLFYSELDEGLWYYLRGHRLAPVPGSQPRYNKGLDLLEDFKQNKIIWNDRERMLTEARALRDWLREKNDLSGYMLIKAKVYDSFAAELAGLAEPVYREQDLQRNELMLLHVKKAGVTSVAAGARRVE